MELISRVFTHGENILLVSSTNKLYIMGNNEYGSCGFKIGTDKTYIENPVYIDIKLDDDDSVKAFYSCNLFTMIHTSKGKIYLSRSFICDGGEIDSYDVETESDDESNAESDAESDSEADAASDSENHSQSNTNTPINNITLINLNSSDIDYDLSDDDSSQSILSDDDSDQVVSDSEYNYHQSESMTEKAGTILLNEIKTMVDEILSQKNINPVGINDIIIRPSGQYMNNIGYITDSGNVPFHTNKNGFLLFKSNVHEVLFVEEMFMYSKNNFIYMALPFKKYQGHLKDMFNSPFHPINKTKNGIKWKYFKIVFPFGAEKIEFCDNFFYTYESNTRYHHVISFYKNVNFYPSWIYFKSEINVESKNMYFSSDTNSVYIKDNNSIYKYYNFNNSLEKYIDNKFDLDVAIMPDSYRPTEMRLLLKLGTTLYSDYNFNGCEDDEEHIFEIMKNQYVPHIINLNYFESFIVVIVNNPNMLTITTDNGKIFFNIHDITFYKRFYNGIVYLDNGSLFYLTDSELSDPNVWKLTGCQLCELADSTIYSYLFNLPDKIDEIYSSSEFIVLKLIGNKYFYYPVENFDGAQDFKTRHGEISLENNSVLELVNTSIINRQSKNYHTTISINIDTDCTTHNSFERLFILTQSLSYSAEYSIRIVDDKNIGFGDGPKIEFCESAIMQFYYKYLIAHNFHTEFNLQEFAKLKPTEIKYLGSMFHMVICQNNSSLPVRLPLDFVVEIYGKEPTIDELEYFACNEDETGFKHIYPAKYNPELVKEFGYESYEHCLKTLCKYNYDDADKKILTKKYCEQLAAGFKRYGNIKNIKQMNLPTLDYYISGPYKINRTILINNLVLSGGKDKNNTYLEMFKEFINSLSENELKILLKNWTASTCVRPDNKYRIIIISKSKNAKAGIRFGTCNLEIHIDEKMLDEHNIDTVKEVLITPAQGFKD